MRVAFEGLWCAADREGRFRWEPERLKVQILPYDEVDFGKILDSLASGGFVLKYVAGDMICGVIPNFKKHQHINIREAESSLPDPESGACTCIQIQDHRSVNIPPEIRKLVFDRDGNRCCRCSASSDLTIDHILPQSMGGNHNPKNLRVMCRACNSARPVSGESFLQDIARDGFTIEYLHGICLHVHARASTSPARVLSLPVPNTVPVPEEGSGGKPDHYHKDTRAALHVLNESSGAHFREVDSNLSVISARLREPDVDLSGVRQMIERQCKRWKGTTQAEYLRPETLFAKSKFDSYYAARNLPINQENGQAGAKRFDRNAGTANEGRAHLYKNRAVQVGVPAEKPVSPTDSGAPPSI